ncbi:glycosyltransferase family 4 protein [Thalassobacillus pellis]|uniref:glycosyltransferase family 4 protein n=1 Tax=Thalassobacillus pellis TaxID=748008 RepID=UPI00195F4FB8|nr:MraY family glycosyltransferase [Thalassobacillus pellis]MBM7551705.1 UDP-GlcNAc:undecaprenyl-phosphate GlcNAc-1-phosphate transferase [Thalassobacillus pellis]
MFDITSLIIAFILAVLTSYILTFPIRKLAVKWKVMDYPELRKIHTTITPRMGGVAIFAGVVVALLYLRPQIPEFLPISIGATIIMVTGLLDDRYQLRPLVKLTGQIIAASILIFSGLLIDNITIPLYGMIELNIFVSVIVTFFWIIGITNAINLIDGLDGLATGVSTIALTSITVMAFIDGRMAVILICISIIGSNIGFLFHNFYPAKIYMGDTGSLFLGYSVAVLSMLGLFKSLTFFSFVIPILVLAIPIFDTLFSILRRLINKKPVLEADNQHIHYQLIASGFSHRTTVLIIYAFSALFGVLAVFFSYASFALALGITFLIVFILHLFAEMTGVVKGGRKPVIDTVKNTAAKTVNKDNKDDKDDKKKKKRTSS